MSGKRLYEESFLISVKMPAYRCFGRDFSGLPAKYFPPLRPKDSPYSLNDYFSWKSREPLSAFATLEKLINRRDSRKDLLFFVCMLLQASPIFFSVSSALLAPGASSGR